MATSNIVHARLDPESEDILARLRRRTGLCDSEIIRRALGALDAQSPAGHRVSIVGLGKFKSGLPDLGSNREHMKGFGR